MSRIYAADFETTTNPEDCRVWAFGLADINAPDDVTTGNDIVGFIRLISDHSSTVYFHNLKFDGTFITNWLLDKGYDWTDERFLAPKEFTTLYSNTGKMYSIRVRWGQKAHVTEFRDSLKKLPMSIATMARAFKLPMRKGELDYHAPRPVGHVLTADELSYIHDDVSILAHAVSTVENSGMKKLTIGADSLDDYKKMIGRKEFARLFPVLDHDTDAAIRRAYRGGYTYADRRRSGVMCEARGVVLDVNSLYPSVMYSRLLPYGHPTEFEGAPADDDRLKIFEVTFTARLKPDKLPIIQVKKSFQFHESEYLEVIDEPVTLSVTNVDWQLWNEHYDIEVYSYQGGYIFQGVTGLFDDYIDKWMRVKKSATGGEREIAKLHLNSLYGKFATSCDVTGKHPTLADDGSVKWESNSPETRDPVYTAMGAFITAYARDVMIRAAQANYDTFAYCDTDSLHLIRPDLPNTLYIDPHELGAWKHEYNFTRAMWVRAKAYAEETDVGDMVVRIAGVPTAISAKLGFDDLYNGNVITGKLVPRNVPGGVVLVPSPYELKM